MYSVSQDIKYNIYGDLAELLVGTEEKITVLDLGCGIMNHTRELLDEPRLERYIAVDPHKPYLDMMQDHPKLEKVNEEANKFLTKIGDYDIILCIDVVEHLEKEDAIKLIKEILNHTKYTAYIFTTDGFQEQNDGQGWGSNNEKWQKHRCGFTKEELEELGIAAVSKEKSPHDALVGVYYGDYWYSSYED